MRDWILPIWSSLNGPSGRNHVFLAFQGPVRKQHTQVNTTILHMKQLGWGQGWSGLLKIQESLVKAVTSEPRDEFGPPDLQLIILPTTQHLRDMEKRKSFIVTLLPARKVQLRGRWQDRRVCLSGARGNQMTALCSDNSLFFPGEGSRCRHYFLEVTPWSLLCCARLRGTGLLLTARVTLRDSFSFSGPWKFLCPLEIQ